MVGQRRVGRLLYRSGHAIRSINLSSGVVLCFVAGIFSLSSRGIVVSPGIRRPALSIPNWTSWNGSMREIGCVGVRGAAHNWPGDGTGYNCSNSNRQSSFVPDANWHTYGLLLIPSTKNSGTGVIQWYYDNVLQISATYSSDGPPNPSTGCSNGAFMTADTQPFTWLLNAATGISVKYRNLHIWQHP